MGRNPKPPELKKLDGNPGKRKIPEVPKVDGTVEKPKFVKGNAAKLWAEFAPICQRLGLLTSADVRAFARWCVETAAYERKPADYPASRLSHLMALESKFCMTPTDRTRYFAGSKAPDPSKSSGAQGKENPFKLLA